MEDSGNHVVRLRVELSELVPEGLGLVRVERPDETVLVVRPDEPMTPALVADLNRHLAHGHAGMIGNTEDWGEEQARPHPSTSH